MIHLRKFTFNPVGVNAYLLWDETNEAIIIDPACSIGTEEEQLGNFITDQGLEVVGIYNTHGHFDHLMGNNFASARWNLKCKIHPEDLPLVVNAKQHALMFGIHMPSPDTAVDLLLEEKITFGNSSLKVIHVPGHSPGSVAFYAEADMFLVVGDILFEGSVGRTDLPGGNHNQLISGIKSKLLPLGDEVIVYSGHGNETTIGKERRYNPFLQ